MSAKTTYALSIAGHDPSGGAGLTMDAQVFAVHGLQPLTVCTAVTVQNAESFRSVNWVSGQLVLEQLKVVLERHLPAVIKIGIIESAEVLLQVLNSIKERVPNTDVVWDPVVKASAGFSLGNYSKQMLDELLPKVDYILPNLAEMEVLTGNPDFRKATSILNTRKGGVIKSVRTDGAMVEDLYFNKRENHFVAHEVTGSDKHGTGCVYSSAFASALAMGESPESSAQQAGKLVGLYRASASGKTGTLFKNRQSSHELQS